MIRVSAGGNPKGVMRDYDGLGGEVRTQCEELRADLFRRVGTSLAALTIVGALTVALVWLAL